MTIMNPSPIYLHQNSLQATTLTICIPVYNGENYIREALDSILLLDMPALVECLVVDNASIDNTVKIALEYAALPALSLKLYSQHSHVRLARNWQSAYSLVTSEIVLFIGHDDKIRKNISEVIHLFEQRKRLNCLITPSIKIQNLGKPFGSYLIEARQIVKKSRSKPTSNDLFHVDNVDALRALSNGMKIPPTGIFFRTSIIKLVGGFDTRLLCLDWDLLIRIACVNGFSIKLTEYTEYRIHEYHITKLLVEGVNREPELMIIKILSNTSVPEQIKNRFCSNCIKFMCNPVLSSVYGQDPLPQKLFQVNMASRSIAQRVQILIHAHSRSKLKSSIYFPFRFYLVKASSISCILTFFLVALLLIYKKVIKAFSLLCRV